MSKENKTNVMNIDENVNVNDTVKDTVKDENTNPEQSINIDAIDWLNIDENTLNLLNEKEKEEMKKLTDEDVKTMSNYTVKRGKNLDTIDFEKWSEPEKYGFYHLYNLNKNSCKEFSKDVNPDAKLIVIKMSQNICNIVSKIMIIKRCNIADAVKIGKLTDAKDNFIITKKDVVKINDGSSLWSVVGAIYSTTKTTFKTTFNGIDYEHKNISFSELPFSLQLKSITNNKETTTTPITNINTLKKIEQKPEPEPEQKPDKDGSKE